MHWDFGWGMGFGWLFMFLFWAVVIAAIVFLVRNLAAGSGRQERGDTALEILKKRYARGELSHEEYIKARDELKRD